jgi:hypothetical protein
MGMAVVAGDYIPNPILPRCRAVSRSAGAVTLGSVPPSTWALAREASRRGRYVIAHDDHPLASERSIGDLANRLVAEEITYPERAVGSEHHPVLDTEREEVVPSATIRSDREPRHSSGPPEYSVTGLYTAGLPLTYTEIALCRSSGHLLSWCRIAVRPPSSLTRTCVQS